MLPLLVKTYALKQSFDYIFIKIRESTYLKIIIEIATTVYANSTPIDNMLTKAARSNNAAKKLVNNAALNVPITGVLKRSEIIPKSRNINPS